MTFSSQSGLHTAWTLLLFYLNLGLETTIALKPFFRQPNCCPSILMTLNTTSEDARLFRSCTDCTLEVWSVHELIGTPGPLDHCNCSTTHNRGLGRRPQASAALCLSFTHFRVRYCVVHPVARGLPTTSRMTLSPPLLEGLSAMCHGLSSTRVKANRWYYS